MRLVYTREGRRAEVSLPPSGGRIRLGRSSECEVFLDDAKASKAHAAIRAEAGPRGTAYVVEDLGSRNGTLVNGRKIDGPTRLQAGDRIRIGATELAATDDAAVAAAPSALAGAAMWLLLLLFFGGATVASRLFFGVLLGRLTGTTN